METPPTLEQLAKKAEEIISLQNHMDITFTERPEEHLKLAIIAGLIDIYNLGYDDASKKDLPF